MRAHAGELVVRQVAPVDRQAVFGERRQHIVAHGLADAGSLLQPGLGCVHGVEPGQQGWVLRGVALELDHPVPRQPLCLLSLRRHAGVHQCLDLLSQGGPGTDALVEAFGEGQPGQFVGGKVLLVHDHRSQGIQ